MRAWQSLVRPDLAEKFTSLLVFTSASGEVNTSKEVNWVGPQSYWPLRGYWPIDLRISASFDAAASLFLRYNSSAA